MYEIIRSSCSMHNWFGDRKKNIQLNIAFYKYIPMKKKEKMEKGKKWYPPKKSFVLIFFASFRHFERNLCMNNEHFFYDGPTIFFFCSLLSSLLIFSPFPSTFFSILYMVLFLCRSFVCCASFPQRIEFLF